MNEYGEERRRWRVWLDRFYDLLGIWPLLYVLVAVAIIFATSH